MLCMSMKPKGIAPESGESGVSACPLSCWRMSSALVPGLFRVSAGRLAKQRAVAADHPSPTCTFALPLLRARNMPWTVVADINSLRELFVVFGRPKI